MRAFACAAMMLALIACARKQPASLQMDPVLEALIPADTTVLLGANIESIKDTEVYHKLLTQLSLPQLNEFTQRTGLDPRKDLSQVISAYNSKTGVLLARGHFKSSEIGPRLEAQGAKRTSYKGLDLYAIDRGGVLFLNSSTAAAGRTAELEALVDRRGQPGHGPPPALAKEVQALPETDQMWVALIGGFKGMNFGVRDDSILGGILEMLHGIETVRLGADLRHGLDLHGEVNCATDRDSKHVHDALKAAVGLGRLNTPDNQPDLLKIYDAIQVTQDQTKTRLTAQIPPDLVDKFIDVWLKRK